MKSVLFGSAGAGGSLVTDLSGFVVATQRLCRARANMVIL